MVRQKASKVSFLALGIILALTFSGTPYLKVAAKSSQYTTRRQMRMFKHYEQKALASGWKKITQKVNGIDRKLMWKAPQKNWKRGIIILLHGGGGSYSNYGANINLGKPMINFANLAIEEGFAVLSPDSTNSLVTGINGYNAGKRWDCLAREDRKNIDLPFFNTIFNNIIPSIRPPGSSKNIFVAGISNGGFMSILVSTQFNDKVKAFSPVSAGDPYGTYLNCKEFRLRKTAPGFFHDSETGKKIGEENASVSNNYPNEKAWPEAKTQNLPAFKFFHNRNDSGVNVSCMEKARVLLKRHGYIDGGVFVLKPKGRKNLLAHFWQDEYNKPMIEFFKRQCSLR